MTGSQQQARPRGLTAQATTLPGAVLVQPEIFRDDRGFFLETMRAERLEDLGLATGGPFVQENHSRSSRGVVRGMHFQLDGMAKLVRCASGTIVDVIVDLRRSSPTYRHWEAFTLDDVDHRQLFVPVGFAHGFATLSERADVLYRQTAYYDPALERTVAHDDPDIGIEWPLERHEITLSARDSQAPRLRDLEHELKS